MIRYVSILFLICCTNICVAQQTTSGNIDEQVITIRQLVQQIDGNSKFYELKGINACGASEGEDVVGYYSKEGLKKIRCSVFGCSFRLSIEYYFNGKEILFAFYKRENYDGPITDNNMKIASTEENRYYFAKGVLVKWIGEKAGGTKSNVQFKEQEKEVRDDVQLYKKLLKW